jgi:Holliday junction DNA helicase RuvA
MIAKLRGRVDSLGDSFVILDVGGVGYLLSCSKQTLGLLTMGAEGVTLWVETMMKAEQLVLYGFSSFEEQECFRLLNTVQGVGGRMALALLSVAPSLRLLQAIAGQDGTFLTQAEGVGPKLANRIVQELKEKVHKLGRSPLGKGALPEPSESSLRDEALSALMNLGYRRLEALEALLQTEREVPQASLQVLIGQTLKILSLPSERISS